MPAYSAGFNAPVPCLLILLTYCPCLLILLASMPQSPASLFCWLIAHACLFCWLQCPVSSFFWHKCPCFLILLALALPPYSAGFNALPPYNVVLNIPAPLFHDNIPYSRPATSTVYPLPPSYTAAFAFQAYISYMPLLWRNIFAVILFNRGMRSFIVMTPVRKKNT